MLIDITNDSPVKISESSTVFIHNSNVNIEYAFSADSRVLIYCDTDEKLVLNETGYVNGCHVEINYLHLDHADLKQNTNIDILSNGLLTINSTYLGVGDKDIVFDIFNREYNSELDITNNVVALDDAKLTLDCIGTIVKGAKSSKCHQKNRCLTMGNPKSAKVLPVLNIDENDVEASHSLSSGTIDDEVLFYMNSRGLNSAQALNLIIKSYLMPDDEFYEGFEEGKNIQISANRKVDDLCSM
ncbi:MAG: SufD family Fe-S cluster assembly protein [Erysipelotrichaceae bacterium]|nr:SufD family Fe-S cluster assembly protein [Erysipelotrichaceae bacterium]